MADIQRFSPKIKSNAPLKSHALPTNKVVSPEDDAQYFERQIKSGSRFTSEQIVRLQRTIGNHSVMRLLDNSSKMTLHESENQKRKFDERRSSAQISFLPKGINRQILIQRKKYENIDKMWADVAPGLELAEIKKIISQDQELVTAYQDLVGNIRYMRFKYQKNRQPEAEIAPKNAKTQRYVINYGKMEDQIDTYRDPVRFVGAILHEMMHIAAAKQYATNVPPGKQNQGHMANMHLPLPQGAIGPQDQGLADNQTEEVIKQMDTMSVNWQHLLKLSESDLNEGMLNKEQQDVIQKRVSYAENTAAMVHYDTVLVDLLFYLVAQRVQNSRTYVFANQMLGEANKRRRAGNGAVEDLVPAQTQTNTNTQII